jgi:hypothetical protein
MLVAFVSGRLSYGYLVGGSVSSNPVCSRALVVAWGRPLS